MFKHYHIDGNKEMVAMGTMNIVGSCFSCYLTTGKSFLSYSSEVSLIFFSCASNINNCPFTNFKILKFLLQVLFEPIT